MLSLLLRSLRGKRAVPAGDDSPSLPPLDAVEGLLERGELQEAERIARARLAVAPGDTEAVGALAGVMAERGSLAEACALAEQVAASGTVRADQLAAAAEIHRRAGRDAAALALAERACALDPRSCVAWILRAMSLESLGRAAEAYDAYRTVIALDPANRSVHSSMLYMLYCTGLLSPQEIVEEHRAWAARHADPLTPRSPGERKEPDPERVLRIGYVSPDFRRHVVAQFIAPVLAAHDRRVVRVHCYSSCVRPDERTLELRNSADVWCDIAGVDDAAAADRIRSDGIDVLVDLAGHTRGNRLGLFALKPAPVQVSWLGYLGTTGMQAMDYCISDGYTDPPGRADAHYIEKLLRLPVTQWCYSPPADAPEVTPLPALGRKHVTFGSVADYSRLNAQVFRAWGRILSDLPTARLRIFGVTSGDPTDALFESLEASGVGAERLELVGQLPHREYLSRLGDIDIVLGSFPYTGATTTCEALWMGVPVVCLAGNVRPSRSSASILSAAGLGMLVAEDWAGYCRIAVDLGAGVSALAEMRERLRGCLRDSPVMDAPGFTRALEGAYREAWRRWCGGPRLPGGHEPMNR